MRNQDTKRLRAILQMVTSISKGEFNFRIPRTQEDDYIEAIAVYLNMMAEEMQETLSFYSSLHVVDGKRHHLQLLFILNHDFRIRYVTGGVTQQLGYETGELQGASFSTVIAPCHLPLWRTIGREMVLSKEYNEQHPVLLVTKDGMERNYLCGFTSIFDTETGLQYIIVSIYEPVLQSKLLEDDKNLTLYITQEDREAGPGKHYIFRDKADIQKLHDIKHDIIKNLDQPLPGLKQLARNYGINEFKLKTGFKQLFGTSVFRFLKQERLGKGKALMTSTDFNLKEIATMSGFLSSTHFIREFRKQYGITPKVFRDGKLKKKLQK